MADSSESTNTVPERVVSITGRDGIGSGDGPRQRGVAGLKKVMPGGLPEPTVTWVDYPNKKD